VNGDTAASAPRMLRIHSGMAMDMLHASDEVGGKAWGLSRLATAGINIPPAFVLDTAACREYFAHGRKLSKTLREAIQQQVRWLEDLTGSAFGSRRNPLLLSVRSGAPVSMPGMMETLLNIGINDESVRGLIRCTGNPRLAWDSYRRLLLGYTGVVHPGRIEMLEAIQSDHLKQQGLRSTVEMDSMAFRQLCTELLQNFHAVTGDEFPRDPWQQLYRSVAAVFDSWFSPRAGTYRAINGIDESTGTACLVQVMVFGNAGSDSGSGVGFTRNPADGKNELYIDYLSNAQGEDIVSGRHDVEDANDLRRKLPGVYTELVALGTRLETEFADMQDFEFTVQQGRLYLLQTRNGKRTPLAALRIAIDMVDEQRITAAEALARIEAIDPAALSISSLAANSDEANWSNAVAASTGVAAGVIALDEHEVREMADAGQPVVLVRQEISTDDITAMHCAVAVVTVTGGRTSHAAVVARQLGIACVVGCRSMHIDMDKRQVHIGDDICTKGSWLTVDADHGRVCTGHLEIERHRPDDLIRRIEQWRTDTRPAAKDATGTPVAE